MEMKEYKVVVKNSKEAEDVRNLFELLGYKKDSFHFNYYYPRSVVTKYYYEWLSTGHACDCKNGEELTITQLRDLVAQKQGLISGADALRALADGKEVQCTITGKNDWTKDIYGIQPYYILGGGVGQFQFRLKPRTISINGIEVPAPFEPKDNENFYVIDCDSKDGYRKISNMIHSSWTQFGAWRTESEIKQVVAALRSVFK